MALIFQCDRCGATGNPALGQRQEGVDGPPKLPEYWATRQLSGDIQLRIGSTEARSNKQVTLCRTCDTSLAQWFTDLPETIV